MQKQIFISWCVSLVCQQKCCSLGKLLSFLIFSSKISHFAVCSLCIYDITLCLSAFWGGNTDRVDLAAMYYDDVYHTTITFPYMRGRVIYHGLWYILKNRISAELPMHREMEPFCCEFYEVLWYLSQSHTVIEWMTVHQNLEILQEEQTKIDHSRTIVCNFNIWGVEFFISFKAKYLWLMKMERSLLCIHYYCPSRRFMDFLGLSANWCLSS